MHASPSNALALALTPTPSQVPQGVHASLSGIPWWSTDVGCPHLTPSPSPIPDPIPNPDPDPDPDPSPDLSPIALAL